jgi:small multidrug resistance pump
MPYVLLALAILAETIGTTALQASQQFTRPLPTLVMVLAYFSAFVMLGFALKYFPVGIAYAIWSGLGIVCIAFIGLFVFGQKLDLPAMLGIGMILCGIIVIHLFSDQSMH